MPNPPTPKVVVELTPEQAKALVTAAEGGYLNLDNPRPALEALSKLDAALDEAIDSLTGYNHSERLSQAETDRDRLQREVDRLSNLQGQTAEGRYQDLRSVHFTEVDEQRDRADRLQRKCERLRETLKELMTADTPHEYSNAMAAARSALDALEEPVSNAEKARDLSEKRW